MASQFQLPAFSTRISSLAHFYFLFILSMWFPWWFSGKETACNVGDLGSIPGLGRYPGERNSDPLQYSCLENAMDRGACVGYSSWGCNELDMT